MIPDESVCSFKAFNYIVIIIYSYTYLTFILFFPKPYPTSPDDKPVISAAIPIAAKIASEE